MSDPEKIIEIQAAVTIPVMAKCRIGHFVEAELLQALGVDYIDESEVLTPADEAHHVDKHGFDVPFVCGCRNLGEALRRIGEGSAMIRTKGEAGTGDIVEAVRHMRAVMGDLRRLQSMREDEWPTFAKDIQAPLETVAEAARSGSPPVVNFAAGGVATPADAALMMRLGAEGVFVGSGIFKAAENLDDVLEIQKQQELRAKAIVEATTHYQDAGIIAAVSRELGEPMTSIARDTLQPEEKLASRGW